MTQLRRSRNNSPEEAAKLGSLSFCIFVLATRLLTEPNRMPASLSRESEPGLRVSQQQALNGPGERPAWRPVRRKPHNLWARLRVNMA